MTEEWRKKRKERREQAERGSTSIDFTDSLSSSLFSPPRPSSSLLSPPLPSSPLLSPPLPSSPHTAHHAHQTSLAVQSATVGQVMKAPSVTPAPRGSLDNLPTSAAPSATAMGTLTLPSPGHVTCPRGCVSSASTTPSGMSASAVHPASSEMPLHKTAHVR